MESLETIIHNSHSISDVTAIPRRIVEHLSLIASKSYKQKGIYTVLTTLLYYKYLYPNQDVRNHQKQIEGGFSGRSFDTKFVTPVLTRLNLPSMKESGWLTRSLEQPNPYDFSYPGKIPQLLKMPFLETLDYLQKNPNHSLDLLRTLFYYVHSVAKDNIVKISPLKNPDSLSIGVIMCALEEHFLTKYGTHNGAKLPVLAFHAIYTTLIKELKRYENCSLGDLSSLTACDRTNKASGDIEIFKNGELFEAIEIKLDRKIDSHMVRIVEEKVYKWNPKRYYILSVYGINDEEREEVFNIIDNISNNHGCQVIINGLLPTIKYYLRLISNLEDFLLSYSDSIMNDTEIQIEHKTKWNELIEKFQF